MDQMSRLIAKADIEDCMKRYARGVDRRDWDMVRGCFHPDATDHHGEFLGNPEEFIDWVKARHGAVPFSMHYLLNCLVEFHADDVAAVETYFWALQRREDGDSGTDHEVFGRYVDRFEQRDGAWRIADRKVTYDSTRTTPSSAGAARPRQASKRSAMRIRRRPRRGGPCTTEILTW